MLRFEPAGPSRTQPWSRHAPGGGLGGQTPGDRPRITRVLAMPHPRPLLQGMPEQEMRAEFERHPETARELLASLYRLVARLEVEGC